MDYKTAGVDIEAGYELVRRIGADVARTFRPGVLGGL
ncbi:MAG: phosphoribosylformylglycinamidine cyclo-ligase, partial [Pseudanabaenaceae cyanobacterium]